MRPLRTISHARRKKALERCCVPNWKTLPVSRTAARSAWSSATLRPIGFSR